MVGSNAPHLKNEILSKIDTASAKEFISTEELQYLSLTRKTKNQSHIIREYLKVGYLTVIYDYIEDNKNDGELVTYWTISHDKNLRYLNQRFNI